MTSELNDVLLGQRLESLHVGLDAGGSHIAAAYSAEMLPVEIVCSLSIRYGGDGPDSALS